MYRTEERAYIITTGERSNPCSKRLSGRVQGSGGPVISQMTALAGVVSLHEEV